MATLRRWYDTAITTLVFVAFSVMLLAALAGTLSRYGSFFPRVSWGEEVTRFAGIWGVFLVSGHAIRHGVHLGVDTLTRYLSPRWSKILSYFIYLNILGFALILVIYGFRLSFSNFSQVSPGLQWSMGVVYLCMPIGGLLMTGEIVAVIVRAMRGREGYLPSTMGTFE